MTTPKAISFLAAILLIGYTLSYITDGIWLNADTKSLFESLTLLKTYTFLGFTLPWVNWEFFTVGLPSLFTFQFSFFGGELEYFKYMLYVFSIGIIWGIIVAVIGVVSGFWSRVV